MKTTFSTPASELEFITLAGPEFDRATQGDWHTHTQAWLATPRLKYYLRRSALIREQDQRTFFLALTGAQHDEDTGLALKHAVGIIELQVSPWGDNEVWLKYVTVHEQYRRQGVVKRLLAMMAEHLKANPRVLSRSAPGKEAPPQLRDYIDRLLDDAGIQWKQSGREETSSSALA